MKGSNRSDTPRGTSKIGDLISSVNTLIDNLSEPVDDAASTVIDRSAAAINRQLEQLEKLFSTQPRTKRRSNHRSDSRRMSTAAAAADDGACSRSPCSNWTASNCNAEGGNSPQGRGPRRSANRRWYSVSATSSSESGYSGCCLIKTGCFAGKPSGSAKQHLPLPPLPSPPLFAASDSIENSSNRRQLVLRRRPRAPPKAADAVNAERAMDFAYLKSGLADDKGHSCTDNVMKMERSVQRMQDKVARLRRRCEQLQGSRGECGFPERLKSEIRRVQTRVSSLHSRVRQTLGTRGAAAQQQRLLGCRHLGYATEQSRDPLTDLKCKYERGLLYSMFDVNWPFLHIVAPRLPSCSDPVCSNDE